MGARVGSNKTAKKAAARPQLSTVQVPLASILCGAEGKVTQVRIVFDPDVVARYAKVMKADAAVFPPVQLVADGRQKYFIADGWHRVLAARQAKLKSIQAHVLPLKQGMTAKESAIDYAMSANLAHGLPPSPGDAAHKARKALTDIPRMSTRSDRAVASAIHVSHQTVSRARNELVRAGRLPHPRTGLTSDRYLPDEYVGAMAFNGTFGRGNPGVETYLRIRSYLEQLDARESAAWTWDSDAERVVHSALVPGKSVVFSVLRNTIKDGLPSEWQEADDEDQQRYSPIPSAVREEREDRDARRRMEAALRRISERGRADLTAAAEVLMRYRDVPGLYADLQHLI